jgi:ribosomal protein L11 methyltransferase
LQAIAALAPRGRPWRLLDFGSGSGILSIAGALLGATVDAVEVDPGARDHAERNFHASGVVERVRSREMLPSTGSFDLVVANILRAVLIEHAHDLVERRGREGALVLSGLVSTDVPEMIAHYAPELGGARPEIYERDEWRGLVWRAPLPATSR